MTRVLNQRIAGHPDIEVSEPMMTFENDIEKRVDEHLDTTFIVVESGSSAGIDADPARVYTHFSPTWIRAMGKKGVIFVFAVGNIDILWIRTHPAFDNVLYIGATARDGETKGATSGFGLPGYLFAAPVYPTLPDADNKTLEGTSFTGPDVAGRIAVELDNNKRLSQAVAIEKVAAIAQPMKNEPLFWMKLLGRGMLPFLMLLVGNALLEEWHSVFRQPELVMAFSRKTFSAA